ncbi:carboxypeptidase-like regulatory domain-containing protein [Seonamhaeicola sp. MEBiC1930]|uniref:carboxypeptidase-like regulatory domain-containing protein n=1 Tax=Seonamhaeicola sp. MEBiC01930 TaxID=2976768 RepID=UPI003249DD8C
MKNVFIITLIVLCFWKTSLAQEVVIIDAFVLEKNTNKPLPYVNIGFLAKSVGTVSDENGKFQLEYSEDNIGELEVLQFSSLGYKTLQIKASNLFSKLATTNKIFLEPQNFSLDKVIITPEEREKKQVGGLDFNGYTIGYWKDGIALGGEIATKIRINKKNSKLLDLKLRVLENRSDSVKLRVNVYDSQKKLPNKNLLNTNIFHIVKKGKRIDTIDLRPYNIKVDDDIIVSIELVEVYGNDIGFVIAGTDSGTTYTRYISQDNWKVIKDAKMAFKLNTSFPKRKAEIVKRIAPKKITILWDTSASMMYNRDAYKEIDFLKAYFNKLKNVSVKVVRFSNEIDDSKVFDINNGNVELLINYLKNSYYEGATNISSLELNDLGIADAILLFSDGFSTLANNNDELESPVFCFSSSKNANHNKLQSISLKTEGYYINLFNTSITSALKILEFDVEDRAIYTLDNEGKNGNVYGKVFTDTTLIEGVSINVKGSFNEVLTNKEGAYSISANYGDVLLVNYFGVEQKEVQVSNKKNINIELEFEGEMLDEVNIETIKEKRDSLSQIARNANRNDGYSSYFLKGDDISPSDIYLADVLRKTPGVNVSGPSLNPKIWIRDRRITPAIFVDGIETLNILSISPQNIASILVLKSFAATNRFGSIAAGGAIMIVTKTAINRSSNKLENRYLSTDNDYDSSKLLAKTNATYSKYINELNSASSFKEALDIYKKQKHSLDQPSISFYFDASEYFERWDSKTAFKILTSIADIAYNNAKALKTLAYKLEALNKYEEAKYIYKRILKLNPKKAQSYRDLALIYQNTGEFNEAMLLYKQMLFGVIEGVDFSGLKDVLVNELRHLVLLHKSEVVYRDLPSDILSINFKQDMRLVFEWNNPLAEFEIQFVNPNNKYFTWELSEFSKKERLLDGLKNGYHVEEFFIDDAENGKWVINIKNLKKEETLTPCYLKYTVFKNFAKPNESKTVRVIKLFEQHKEATLDEFMYSSN